MRFYGRKTTLLTCILLTSLIGVSSLVSACFSQTTTCEGASVSQGDGGATDYWYDDLYPPIHTVKLYEGTEWIINVHGGGGCSNYEHLTVTDEEDPPGWKTTITMGTIYNGNFHYIPFHLPVQEGDDIENREIYIGNFWNFDIIYNVTNDGSSLDCLDQICTVYVVGYDPENQHDYVFIHTNTHIEDSPPLVTVTSPNGNESWGGTHDITWNAIDDQPWGLTPIDIFYSTSGTTGPWIEINEGSYSHYDDGIESWTLPTNVESQDCYVKVVATDAKGQSTPDISDGAFEIDTVIPIVECTDPKNDEGGVPLSKKIIVLFSEPMDTSSVTITQTGGSDPGGWSWTWSPCKKQVTGTHNNWNFGEEVEMTISAGFADDTNPPNANNAAYVWNFTITPMEVDKVVIEDEPGGVGDSVLDQTIPVGFIIAGWAAGYNTTTGEYIGDIDVNWFVTNSNGAGASTSPPSGVSSTFDAGGTSGNAIWKICDAKGHQYEVNLEIVEPCIDYVIIRDAPHGGGNPIEDQTIDVDANVMGYSAGYNDIFGYIKDIDTNWDVQNLNDATASTFPLYGSSSTFYSGLSSGTAIWKACDGKGNFDSVTFTIVEMVDYIRIEYAGGEEINDVTLTADGTLDCYARAYNYATGLIGDIAVDWTVYEGVGTLSPIHGTMTTLDATTVGTGQIHANDGNLHTDDTGDITVTHGECFSVSVSPEKTTIISDMDEQFIAICSDLYGNTWEGIDGVWSETDPKGTISNTGLYNPGKIGTWTIKYTENDVFGTAKATVKMGSITSIKITPETWSGTADDTVTFTAIGMDSNGNEQDITEFTTFTTSDPSGYCNLNIYYPTKKGNWEVIGEFHSLTDSASVSVSQGALYQIVIEDEDGNELNMLSLVIGQSFDTYARGYDEDGNPLGDVYASWESDDKSICEVEPEEGYSTEVTIMGSGSCTISAENSEFSCSLTISIPIDSDSDGLSDIWEIDSFGHLDYDGNDDPDNDGITNLEEYLKGSDPMTAESVKDDYLAIYILIFIMVAIILFTILLIIFRRKK